MLEETSPKPPVVLDTKVVISGLVWGGHPDAIVELAFGRRIELFTSTKLLDELQELFSRSKIANYLRKRQLDGQKLFESYATTCQQVAVSKLTPAICRDPDDDWVLATANAAQAHMLVSGDKDLTDLKHYASIEILSPAQALERLRQFV